MTGKLSIILTVVMLGAIVLVACSPAAPAVPTQVPQAPSPAAPTQVPKAPTLNKVTCSGDDAVCIITNVIDNFKNGCRPVVVEVVVTAGDGTKVPVTFTISSGENGACHFQVKGLGPDQDCLFAKENVIEKVVKGMFNMDNIQNDPEFQKIKAASCK
jgi:hypothetical protein